MKVIGSVLALGFGLLLCISCSHDPDPTAPASVPDKSDVDDYKVVCDSNLHAECESLLVDDPELAMCDTVVTYDCRQGVFIDATPDSWGSDHEVTLSISAGAVDSVQAVGLGQPYPYITITISVPRDGPTPPDGEYTPNVPFDFDPHGLEFNLPADLRVCWPEWAGVFLPEGAFLAHVEPTYVIGELHYTLVEKEFSLLGEKDGMLDIDTECDFDIGHFSRWSLVNGTKPPGGTGGGPDIDGHTDKTDFNPDFEYPRDYLFYTVTQTPDEVCCGTKVLIDRGDGGGTID